MFGDASIVTYAFYLSDMRFINVYAFYVLPQETTSIYNYLIFNVFIVSGLRTFPKHAH